MTTSIWVRFRTAAGEVVERAIEEMARGDQGLKLQLEQAARQLAGEDYEDDEIVSELWRRRQRHVVERRVKMKRSTTPASQEQSTEPADSELSLSQLNGLPIGSIVQARVGGIKATKTYEGWKSESTGKTVSPSDLHQHLGPITLVRRAPEATTDTEFPGAELVEDGQDSWTFHITTWEGAKKLGTTNWCIVRDKDTWNDYKSNGVDFYFHVLKKTGPPADYAVAVMVGEDGQKHSETYGSEDEIILKDIEGVHEFHKGKGVENTPAILTQQLDDIIDRKPGAFTAMAKNQFVANGGLGQVLDTKKISVEKIRAAVDALASQRWGNSLSWERSEIFRLLTSRLPSGEIINVIHEQHWLNEGQSICDMASKWYAARFDDEDVKRWLRIGVDDPKIVLAFREAGVSWNEVALWLSKLPLGEIERLKDAPAEEWVRLAKDFSDAENAKYKKGAIRVTAKPIKTSPDRSKSNLVDEKADKAFRYSGPTYTDEHGKKHRKTPGAVNDGSTDREVGIGTKDVGSGGMGASASIRMTATSARPLTITAQLGNFILRRVGHGTYTGEFNGKKIRVQSEELIEHGSYPGNRRQKRSTLWKVAIDGIDAGEAPTLREARALAYDKCVTVPPTTRVAGVIQVLDTEGQEHTAHIESVKDGDRVKFKDAFVGETKEGKVSIAAGALATVQAVRVDGPTLIVEARGEMKKGKSLQIGMHSVEVPVDAVQLILSSGDPRAL